MLEILMWISSLILVVGIIGLIFSLNLVSILISMEILFLSSNFFFSVISTFLDDIVGLIFSIFILCLAGAEISIGLSLTILIYKLYNNIFLFNLVNLKA